MEKLTRRDLLRMSAITMAGAVAAACARTLEPTILPTEEPITAPGSTARVAAIRGNDLSAMTCHQNGPLKGDGARGPGGCGWNRKNRARG